jgi:hypothetical protein
MEIGIAGIRKKQTNVDARVFAVPVPYVFYKYGPWIRSKSKYAITGTTNKE